MYSISRPTIIVGLLLLTSVVSKTSSIKCVVCEGNGPFSKCESSKNANTTLCPAKYPYCSIETREAYGTINLIRRRCSNRHLTLTNNTKMHLLNPKTNVSLCVYQKALICAWLCDIDLCNGLSNRSPPIGRDTKLFQYLIILTLLFVFDFKQTMPIDT